MYACLNVLLLATSKAWVRNVWIDVTTEEVAEITALMLWPNSPYIPAREPDRKIINSILCSLFEAANLDDDGSELPSMSSGDVALIGQASYLCLPQGWKRLTENELSDYCQMDVLDRVNYCQLELPDFT